MATPFTVTTEESTGNGSDAAAIIEAVERLGAPEIIALGAENNNNSIIVAPKGYSLHSLKALRDELRAKPERVQGCATLTTLASFIDHVNRFKGSNSTVFASTKQLIAVYDYHDKSSPEWCQHLAQYRFPLSAEWVAWSQVDGRSLQQAAFAEFLEQRVSDVTAPTENDREHFGELNYALATPAQLLSLSRGLLVRVEMEAVARPNLSTGESEVSYKEAHSDGAGAPLKIPGGFMLLIPPFEDGPRYRIPVRLRYRVSSGKVVWSIHLHRADVALRDATKDACEEVIEKTSAPLFHGRPERTKSLRDVLIPDDDD